MKLPMFEPPLDLVDRLERIGLVREIDLDVIFRSRLPRAILRKGMTRTGDDAPAGGREPFDRRVADAAACPSEQQGASRFFRRTGHDGANTSSGIEPRLDPWLAGLGAAEFNAVVQAERAVLPEFDDERHDAIADPVRRARNIADPVFCRVD